MLHLLIPMFCGPFFVFFTEPVISVLTCFSKFKDPWAECQNYYWFYIYTTHSSMLLYKYNGLQQIKIEVYKGLEFKN
jgi:hypothetical protein